MINTNMPQNCTVFLVHRELTRSAILWSQNFDSTKWPTVFLRDVIKGKPGNYEVSLCRSLSSTFKISFYPYAFNNKWLSNALQRPTRPIQGNVFLKRCYCSRF